MCTCPPSFPPKLWTVEVRRAGEPVFDATAGQSIQLPTGGRAVLLAPYAEHPAGVRLWVAKLDVPERLHTYLAAHGRPIRYGYVQGSWPISAYQNVYVTEPGSAVRAAAARSPSSGTPCLMPR
jgi:S-adenosylmethionine:tRNA ribosyltransferase-isomerase